MAKDDTTSTDKPKGALLTEEQARALFVPALTELRERAEKAEAELASRIMSGSQATDANERAKLTAERDAALAEIARRDAAAAREAEVAAARDKDRAEARAAKRTAIDNGLAAPPPRMLGTIPIYLDDEPHDVIERARPLYIGQIPADRARRFKIDGRLTLSPKWKGGAVNKLHARHGVSPPIGAEFDADDMPLEERVGYAAQGAIVPLA